MGTQRANTKVSRNIHISRKRKKQIHSYQLDGHQRHQTFMHIIFSATPRNSFKVNDRWSEKLLRARICELFFMYFFSPSHIFFHTWIVVCGLSLSWAERNVELVVTAILSWRDKEKVFKRTLTILVFLADRVDSHEMGRTCAWKELESWFARF